MSDGQIKIIYRNWRGEISERTIKPLGALVFGTSPYHREAQWLLPAMDIDKGQERTFALRDILAFPPNVAMTWQPIETAPKDKVSVFWLDWADDCASLNPPLGDSGRRFVGYFECWSSIHKATHWMPLPPAPEKVLHP